MTDIPNKTPQGSLNTGIFETPPLLLQRLHAAHPADAASVLEALSSDSFQAFAKEVGVHVSADIIIELSADRQTQILDVFGAENIAQLLVEVDSDDATALLSRVGESQKGAVLNALSVGFRAQLEDGLTYGESSAGRLMQREFIALPGFWTIETTLRYLRDPETQSPSVFYEIYVVDTAHKLLGFIPLSDVMTAKAGQTLEALNQPLQSDVHVALDQEDVAFQFRKYSLASAPVKDGAGRLVGMITVDDMVDVLHQEHAEDLLALSNVTAKNQRGIWPAARSRTPWLLLNLVTAIGVSWVISLFEVTLDAIVFLAILMPIIAVISGNAGNQALAVAIRDMTEQTLQGKAISRAIVREACVGLINGLIIGLVLGCVTYLWRGDIGIALIAGASIFFALMLAGLLGLLIPLGLRAVRADPAIASTVFVLSLTDLISFLSFLGLASLFLL